MHLPHHHHRTYIPNWRDLVEVTIQAPCNNDSQDGCKRVMHINKNGWLWNYGVAIHSTSRCGSRWPYDDHHDELYKVMTFELSNSRHDSEGILEQVFERRCCCALYLKVKQCGTIDAPETPLFGEPQEGELANCGLIPRDICKDIIPIPDENHILAISHIDYVGNKICYTSLPPNASNDVCGNEPPSFVVSTVCSYGCGTAPPDKPMQEIAMAYPVIVEHKYELREFDPLMVYDPDGITSNRLCLELCGPCYAKFIPCGTCPDTLGECLASTSCDGTGATGMKAVNYDCQQQMCDGVPCCYGPLFGPWCEECFRRGETYTGEEVALSDSLYHTQCCGCNHPGHDFLFDHDPCHACAFRLHSQCTSCKRAHVEAPPPFCRSGKWLPTSVGAPPSMQLGKTHRYNADGTEDRGWACYRGSGHTTNAPQLTYPDDLEIHLLGGSDCYDPDPDSNVFQNGMCLSPPLLGESTIDTRNIKESFQKSFSPESVELEIDLLNLIDLIDKTIVVSFGLPRPYSLEVGFDDGKTALTNPTVYYLLPHPDMREISEDTALGMIAMGGVPAVRKAIYLKEYSDENGDVFSMWISFTDLYASTNLESKKRLFHTSYQVFSYCNCKTKNCSCDVPSKSIGSRVSISFGLRSEDEQELRSENEQGYTKI